MKENIFIEKNKVYWDELENHVHLFSKHNITNIPSEKIERFLYLFRSASHHLAYVRTHYPQSKLEKYLNTLVGHAHQHLYTVQKNPWVDFKNYITKNFPNSLRNHHLFILSSFLVFLLGAIISFIMVIQDSSNSYYFLPKAFLNTIDYSFKNREWDYPLMSSTIMINNITVSLKAFIFGIFLGIGTIYILFVNGCLLGALTGLVYLNGDLIKYASLILPHGIIELTAIFIAGGAGLLLGKGLLIPGKTKRLDCLIESGKEGAHLLLGCMLLLVVAGIIEGFFTPLAISPIIKLLFASFTLLGLILYMKFFKSSI
ncbi:stage II sporulation protein M [Crassaminicella profunda]|uniref:stage II sporulation protein M n=1 Tax=Crassaminicella profunda TaxID=1286698 RepID=UPI001CA6D12D|nr:stage II sporulation protein M [Crassaminicella profunda]QZY56418.1 stage II sporulation protein M [Crassaminicella profunda]